MKPEVSVIMSVYNPYSTDYLLRSVNAIKNQTFTDWEMIICDDGSFNIHHKMMEEIAASDDRITLITNDKNMGLGASLNRCIKKAKGDYIARMDVDDTCNPDRLKVQVDFLKKHQKIAWCGTDAFLFNDNGRWGSRHMPVRPKKCDFLHYSPYIHSSVMFKRDVLTRNRGYKAMHRAEDYELFMRLTALGYRGCNIPAELYGYREDENNYKRRTLRCALEESYVRNDGFKKLGMRTPINFGYVVKPLIISMIPIKLQMILKRDAKEDL